VSVPELPDDFDVFAIREHPKPANDTVEAAE